MLICHAALGRFSNRHYGSYRLDRKYGCSAGHPKGRPSGDALSSVLGVRVVGYAAPHPSRPQTCVCRYQSGSRRPLQLPSDCRVSSRNSRDLRFVVFASLVLFEAVLTLEEFCAFNAVPLTQAGEILCRLGVFVLGEMAGGAEIGVDLIETSGNSVGLQVLRRCWIDTTYLVMRLRLNSPHCTHFNTESLGEG